MMKRALLACVMALGILPFGGSRVLGDTSARCFGPCQDCMRLGLYDVRDLLFTLSGSWGTWMDRLVERHSPIKGPAGKRLKLPDDPWTEDFVVEFIRLNIGDGSAKGRSYELLNGILIVKDDRRAHGEIRTLLRWLRQFR